MVNKRNERGKARRPAENHGTRFAIYVGNGFKKPKLTTKPTAFGGCRVHLPFSQAGERSDRARHTANENV